MKFILENEKLKIDSALLGGYELYLVADENNNLSYEVEFPGLSNPIIELLNKPDWLNFDSSNNKLTGTPNGNNAGKLILKMKVTHDNGVIYENLEILINSTIEVNENDSGVFVLPIFNDLSGNSDLKDNILDDSCSNNPGISLDLLDLSGTKFYDLTENDLSNNWLLSDEDWKTLGGDILYYEALMDGVKLPKTGNWVTFDRGVFTFNPTQDNVGVHAITINAYDQDGHEQVKSKVISVNIKDVNVVNKNTLDDITISDGNSGSFTLPEFEDIAKYDDLTDNVFQDLSGNWGLDLSLNDLSENGLLDLSENWNFFDHDFNTNTGDKLTYSAKILTNGAVFNVPSENNWITFKKGKLSYTPEHKHVGTHKITLSAKDQDGNISSFSFSLTVTDSHIRNTFNNRTMFTDEVLEFVLPEFQDLLNMNDLSDNILQDSNGNWMIDLSLNDLTNNGLWDSTNNTLIKNDLSGNWKFFDSDLGTVSGDKVTYKVFINNEVMPSENNWATFNKGKFTFKPTHDLDGVHEIKVLTVDQEGNESTQTFTLTVTCKYIRNDFDDLAVNEGETLEYTLPEFADALAVADLNDNIFEEDGYWGLDLSLNDLSSNKFWDFSENDLSSNDLSGNWKFFDTDFGTNIGDKVVYKVEINGVKMPTSNNWATFNKGKFTFEPTGENLGIYTITVSTTDLNDNVCSQQFKLTIDSVDTPYLRSKYGNNSNFETNYEINIDSESNLELTLPEFNALKCLNNSFLQDALDGNSITLKSSDFSKYDIPSNLTDNWLFYNPHWDKASGGKLSYKLYHNTYLVPTSNNWATFSNGKLTINPTHITRKTNKLVGKIGRAHV